jgi:transcriptional regulator GlxA family with amidase domain
MNFGVLIFPDVEELDFAGPWEMLGMWSKVDGRPDLRVIVAESGRAVPCAKGLTVVPHTSFDECPALDYLLVPGGEGTRREVDNPVIIDFLAEQAKSCQGILSVCTGAFLLHKAGLLSSRKATTHWNSIGRLRSLGDVTVVEERVVNDGNVWTAAGVSAGIDLMLAFIARVAGEDVAGMVQFGTEYYPSSKLYGQYYRHPQAPAYLKKSAP